MTKNIKIAASILSADFSCLGREIEEAKAAGADWIHVDVMDGHFVPNITMGPFIVEACRQLTGLPIDVHLMIENPERYLEDFVLAGATYLSVHVENQPNLHRTLQTIRELGCNPGVVINPGTPASFCLPVLHMIDLVLIMSVNPGFSGQTFLPEVLPKVAYIRDQIDHNEFDIHLEIDGGIDAGTLPKAHNAGARVFVSASAIFKHPEGIHKGIQSLKNSVK